MKAYLKGNIKRIGLLILLFAGSILHGQADTTEAISGQDSLRIYQPDTFAATTENERDTGRYHDTKRAALLALVPGLGQIYNRKYWKVPIVYAALGTGIYMAVDYHQEYQLYLNAFYSQIDDDPDNDQLTAANPRQLVEYQNYYRRQRDLTIIITSALYGLQILDAYVDAHLFHYDISDDLSLQWEPRMLRSPSSPSIPAAYGLGLTFNLQ